MTGETMKAVRIYAYGGPEVLVYEDAPIPPFSPAEVLIRVYATGVNPVDRGTRLGYLQAEFKFTMPLILGWDFSGEIVGVGAAAAATGVQVGQQVYGMISFRGGTNAQYLVARPGEFTTKPTTIDHVQAAAVPLAGLTAWQALFRGADLTAGQSVLIHGAAGGVGSFAVQFAKAKGARVIGTASTRNLDFVQELGADQVIDHTASQFEELVHAVDVVLDTIGGDTQDRSWQTLKPGGVLATVVPFSQPLNPPDGKRFVIVGVRDSATDLTEIARLIDAGQVKPRVTTVLPLSQARQAHELNEAGHTQGKIVLTID